MQAQSPLAKVPGIGALKHSGTSSARRQQLEQNRRDGGLQRRALARQPDREYAAIFRHRSRLGGHYPIRAGQPLSKPLICRFGERSDE
jgi:hypothetical protein